MEGESERLGPEDPFRKRPASSWTRRSDVGIRPEIALAASDSARAMADEILESSKDLSTLRRRLQHTSLEDVSNRFALLYALQEGGRRIAENPIRMLRFAEEVMTRLRAPRLDHSAESDAERAVPHLVLLAQAHMLAGQGCNWASDFGKAGSHFEIAYRSLGRIAGEELSLAMVEHLESQRRSFIGRAEEALVLARRAAATFEALEIEDWVARARVCEGLALARVGRPEDAIRAYRATLPVFEGRRLWSNYVTTLNSIGAALEKMGRLDEARREYARALRRISRERHRSVLAFIRHGLADVLCSAQRYREAAISFAQASRLYAESGLFASSLMASLSEIENWARHGDLSRARHRLEVFQGEIVRSGALDTSVSSRIEAALAGSSPDYQSLGEIVRQAQILLGDRQTARSA